MVRRQFRDQDGWQGTVLDAQSIEVMKAIKDAMKAHTLDWSPSAEDVEGGCSNQMCDEGTVERLRHEAVCHKTAGQQISQGKKGEGMLRLVEYPEPRNISPSLG